MVRVVAANRWQLFGFEGFVDPAAVDFAPTCLLQAKVRLIGGPQPREPPCVKAWANDGFVTKIDGC